MKSHGDGQGEFSSYTSEAYQLQGRSDNCSPFSNRGGNSGNSSRGGGSGGGGGGSGSGGNGGRKSTVGSRKRKATGLICPYVESEHRVGRKGINKCERLFPDFIALR